MYPHILVFYFGKNKSVKEQVLGQRVYAVVILLGITFTVMLAMYAVVELEKHLERNRRAKQVFEFSHNAHILL